MIPTKPPNAEKKAAIARAAKHVLAQPDTEITEVIEKDEDRHISFADRCAAAAAMFFGITVGLLIILLFIIVLSGKAGAGLTILVGYKGYGFKILAIVIAAFVIGAFVRPSRTMRVFGYLMKPFSEIFQAIQ